MYFQKKYVRIMDSHISIVFPTINMMEICETIILTYFFRNYIGNMEHISNIFPSYFQWKYEAAHPVRAAWVGGKSEEVW